ncbi:uncharacterized protein BDW47DRAFT_93598 [Aspergillus candidus]|uniref:Uncharacterized protein n=1 Tax=Aspergillus candidus TaxID=41067 RepID=A0A2I2FI09_ASPCN|nr:hypothetical protein BDW47DRAFT_93598 [Aspergillus candidus]PLB40249.1 hypothetical protein BDW47DRAFT_93598 [Aspergillus candidus]
MNSPYRAYSPYCGGHGYHHRHSSFRRLGPRARVGGLVKVALVGTCTYFICKKVIFAGARSDGQSP